MNDGNRRPVLLTGDKSNFGRYYGQTVGGVLVLPPIQYLHSRR